MGMFDEIRSSYQGLLGCFQTKDLDNYLLHFYLDPAGVLWRVDYTGTQTVHLGETCTPIPNGNRGRVYPTYITRTITVSSDSCSPDGLIESYDYHLHFVEGVLESVSIK